MWISYQVQMTDVALADPGGLGAQTPLPPRFFSKSCSFQAILRGSPYFYKFWVQPSWGQNSADSPDQNPGSDPPLCWQIKTEIWRVKTQTFCLPNWHCQKIQILAKTSLLLVSSLGRMAELEFSGTFVVWENALTDCNSPELQNCGWNCPVELKAKS